MSDNYNDDDLDIEVDEQSDESPRGLRRAANKAKKLEAELNQLRRELAFAKAGLPLDDPKMNYFIKGYDGEMDAEAIREAAEEAGFLQTQAAPQVQQAQPQEAPEASAQQRVMRASVGAATEDISEEAAIARMEEAMQEGGIPALLEVAQQYGIPTSE
jgi:tRNA(Glu) U13 pseudouridine synthase TruD